MKLEKINGKYVKKRLRPESSVPLLVWLPIVLLIATGVMLYSLKAYLLQMDGHPELVLSRMHSYKIVAVGDIACSPDDANYNNGEGIVDACRQKAVGYAVEKERADSVMLLGDIQYPSGTLADYNRSFVPYWRNINVPIYSVAGNHDYGNGERTPGLEGYSQTFNSFFPQAVYKEEGKSYYSFNIGQWQFYALDSNCAYVGGCGEGSNQLNWLTRQVSSTPAKCSIGLWHHPVFTSGVHRTEPDTTYGRDFWNVLESAGTDIVLNGHDHNYERFGPQTLSGVSSKNGIREFVSGAGGYSLRKVSSPYASNSEMRIDNKFGYLVLDLSPGHYSWQFKDIAGEVLDSGSDSCR